MLRRSEEIPYPLVILKRDLDSAFQRYLLTGGVPRAINDLLTKDRISQDTFNTYVEVLRGDLGHWKRDTWIAKELLARLVRSMGSYVSWNDIASEMGPRQPTIKDYIWTLEQCFVITYLHRTVNLRTSQIKSQKGKKVYFEDPFMFHAIRYWVSSSSQKDACQFATEYLKDSTNQGHLVENVVANHLIRLQFNMAPSSSFQYNHNLFYSLPTKRTEIDFIFRTKEGAIPIEVKYRSSTTSRDLEAITRVASPGRNERHFGFEGR